MLRVRFGLDGQGDHTLGETGDEFGVSRERIRQVEKKVLGFLRLPRYAMRLREFL